jgi:hypothetical protein
MHLKVMLRYFNYTRKMIDHLGIKTAQATLQENFAFLIPAIH